MFEWLRESIWGFPIIAALHVLGMAWFAGLVVARNFHAPRLKWIGMALMVLSGVLLFGLHPARYSGSIAFQIKLLLLVLVAIPKMPRPAQFVLWIGIIFAARFTAFF
jgi:hypothetical protein